MDNQLNINNFFIDILRQIEDTAYINNDFEKNEFVLNIQKNIKGYILQNCKHEIETDYIDITPEQSQKIYYCKKCMLNL